MANTETSLCNLALLRMGQNLIDDIDGSTQLEKKCNLIFDQQLGELLTAGPEKGWKFAKRTYHGINVNSATITAFTDLVTDTTTTVTATHTFSAGDRVTITGTTNYDGTYVIASVSTTVSFVIEKAYVADDATGTVTWTSNKNEYRFAIPSCKKVTEVSVGGVELSDWYRDGIYILTRMEDTELDMDIVQSITDVTLLPDHFVKVLVLKMAIALHYNLTQDLKAIQLLEQELVFALPKAIAIDEGEKYVREESTSWVSIGRNLEVLE